MGERAIVVEHRRRILSESDLFGQLKEAEIDRILAFSRVETAGKGEVVIHQGGEPDRLYVLLTGRLAVVGVNPEGKQIAMRLLEPGDVFGEIGLLDQLPRSADVVAEERSECLTLRRDDFERVVLEDPRVAIKLMFVLARRLRLATEQLEDVAFLPLRSRLSKTLLRLAARYGRASETGIRIEIRMTLRLLAELVGATREMVNMQVLEWEKAGLLSREDRRITIRDRDALHRAGSASRKPTA